MDAVVSALTVQRENGRAGIEITLHRDVPDAAARLGPVNHGAVEVANHHLVEGHLLGARGLVPHVEGGAELFVVDSMQVHCQDDGLGVGPAPGTSGVPA